MLRWYTRSFWPYVILFVCAFFLLGGIVFSLRTEGQERSMVFMSSSGQERLNSSSEKTRWTSRIAEVGPQQAYEEFVFAYKDLPKFSHKAMHLMADLLYDKWSLDALAYCDNSFGYACYHQYFSRAISEYGVTIVPKLGELCISIVEGHSGTCMHGIGHGLIDLFGPKKLDLAFEECLSLSAFSYATKNCRIGVLMEYLAPIYIDETNSQLVAPPYDPSAPYAPCEAGVITTEYKPYCYQALPAWWRRVANLDATTYIPLCSGAPAKYQRSCFIGAGQESFNDQNYDIEASKRVCESAQNANAIAWCFSGVDLYSFLAPTVHGSAQ